jgi:hypothetical protein
MVRTMLSAATTAQFLCLAASPRDRASNTRDWPFGANHTISRRTPDPSSRPSDPFLHLEGRESTLDPRNEKTASSLDPPTEGREVKRANEIKKRTRKKLARDYPTQRV